MPFSYIKNKYLIADLQKVVVELISNQLNGSLLRYTNHRIAQRANGGWVS